MTYTPLKSILGILFFSCSSLVNAAEVELDHKVSCEQLEKRPVMFKFTVPNEQSQFAIVRADKKDIEGFRLKNSRKTNNERLKFQSQFSIESSSKILEIYQNAKDWKVEAFKNYLFGLFSIYNLTEETGTFCGELNLDEQSLSTGSFIEISIDIDPSKRKLGIGKAATQAVLKNILTPNLGKKGLSVINYKNTSNKSNMRKKGFSESLLPLKYLKSKVEFNNLPSHKINNALGMVPWNFSVDYSVVYVYPIFKSCLTQQAIPLVKALTSGKEEERQQAIKILMHSIDIMNN